MAKRKSVKHKNCIVCGSIEQNSILHKLPEPEDVVRYNEWVKNILEFNPAAEIKKFSKICQVHFKKSDVLGHHYLKSTATPTLKGSHESAVFDLGLDLLANVGHQAPEVCHREQSSLPVTSDHTMGPVGSDIVEMEVHEEGYIIKLEANDMETEVPEELPNQHEGNGDHSSNEPTILHGLLTAIPNNDTTALERSKKTRKSFVGDFNISDMSNLDLAKSFYIIGNSDIENKIKKIAILRRKVKTLEQKTKAKPNYEQYCCKCNKTFEAEIYLVNHFNEEHPNGVRSHYDHMKKNDPNTVQCILCKSFVKDIVRHRRRQLGPTLVRNDYQCKHCGKAFKTKKTMRNCELKHEGVEIKRLQCPKCPATLSKRSNLTEHIKLHSEVYRFECHLCGKTCKKLSNLKVHLLLTHSTKKNAKNVLCEICGMAMKKKSSMKIHMRTHTGVRPFKCSYCEKTYHDKTIRKRHELVHTGYRPYGCSYCDRGFFKKSSMIEHERSHAVPL